MVGRLLAGPMAGSIPGQIWAHLLRSRNGPPICHVMALDSADRRGVGRLITVRLTICTRYRLVSFCPARSEIRMDSRAT